MWAVGVILFEMLAGQVPFFSEYEKEIRDLIKDCKIDFRPIKTSPIIEDLVRKLLVKNRDTRIAPTEALNHAVFSKILKES